MWESSHLHVPCFACSRGHIELGEQRWNRDKQESSRVWIRFSGRCVELPWQIVLSLPPAQTGSRCLCSVVMGSSVTSKSEFLFFTGKTEPRSTSQFVNISRSTS